MKVKIRTLDKEFPDFQVNPLWTIKKLAKNLMKTLQFPDLAFSIHHKGRVLSTEESTLSEYGIRDGDVLILMFEEKTDTPHDFQSIKESGSGEKKSKIAIEAAINEMISLGYPREQVENVFKKANYDINQALSLLLSNALRDNSRQDPTSIPGTTGSDLRPTLRSTFGGDFPFRGMRRPSSRPGAMAGPPPNSFQPELGINTPFTSTGSNDPTYNGGAMPRFASGRGLRPPARPKAQMLWNQDELSEEMGMFGGSAGVAHSTSQNSVPSVNDAQIREENSSSDDNSDIEGNLKTIHKEYIEKSPTKKETKVHSIFSPSDVPQYRVRQAPPQYQPSAPPSYRMGPSASPAYGMGSSIPPSYGMGPSASPAYGMGSSYEMRPAVSPSYGMRPSMGDQERQMPSPPSGYRYHQSPASRVRPPPRTTLPGTSFADNADRFIANIRNPLMRQQIIDGVRLVNPDVAFALERDPEAVIRILEGQKNPIPLDKKYKITLEQAALLEKFIKMGYNEVQAYQALWATEFNEEYALAFLKEQQQ